VGATTIVPMDGDGWHDPIFAEDKVYAEGQIPPLRTFKMVSPGLLKTMGNRVIAGRELTWTDVYEKRRVLLVTENLARELWHDPQAALGKRVRENLKGEWREIVGVVSDERDNGLNEKAPTTAIFPMYMEKFEGDDIFVARSLAYMIRSSRAGSHALLGEIG